MRWACSAAVGSGAPCGEALCALAASSTFIVDPMTLMLFIASAARASCAGKRCTALSGCESLPYACCLVTLIKLSHGRRSLTPAALMSTAGRGLQHGQALSGGARRSYLRPDCQPGSRCDPVSDSSAAPLCV